MRTTNLYQIYDRNAEQVLGTIMAVNRDGPAIRTFLDVIKNPETELAKHPEDFELLHIGIQDLDTGNIMPLIEDDGIARQRPRVVISGKQWIQTQEADK